MKLVNILKESIIYRTQVESNDKKMIEDFVDFVKRELSIKEDIDVILQNDKSGIKTTAVYNYGGGEKSSIKVYCKDRQLVDILRSIAHEMTHHMQFETGKLDEKPADVGGPIEDEANSKAGEFIKKFAQLGNDIYPEGVKPEDISEQDEFASIRILDMDDEESSREKELSHIKDQRLKLLMSKFENTEYEFGNGDLNGSAKIVSLKPKGAEYSFNYDDLNFDKTKSVVMSVRLNELRYKGEIVPIPFYHEISRYLPPEEEEESYRGNPVESALWGKIDSGTLKDIQRMCKGLGVHLEVINIIR